MRGVLDGIRIRINPRNSMKMSEKQANAFRRLIHWTLGYFTEEEIEKLKKLPDVEMDFTEASLLVGGVFCLSEPGGPDSKDDAKTCQNEITSIAKKYSIL